MLSDASSIPMGGPSSSVSLRLCDSKCLALDIGGANLKAADGRGFAVSLPFPLWRRPDQLSAAIEQLIATAPTCERIAVTMTGELADCFQTKADGVRSIVHAAATAAGNRPVEIYLNDGRLVSPAVAVAEGLLAAASNWHVLARFAGRFLNGEPGLLIDLGSTTADIIPLVDGQPAASGRTDTQRLLSYELAYTGVERTPVCAVVDAIPYRGYWCPVARELFATMWDVYLVLGELPEEIDSLHTADGRPATTAAAIDRLARMICADRESFDQIDAIVAARHIAASQRRQLETAIDRVLTCLSSPPKTIVIAGQGEFLLQQILKQRGIGERRVSLSEQLGPVLSRCAPAHALAVIAAQDTSHAPP
ncbi:MAG: tetrahydromethanopterin-linked C1 transfer pathway [Pirellulales bacterium]|nr:tetrahydromethanopterin-linked C1 transfer pathway [Pirellulales bacterium]